MAGEYQGDPSQEPRVAIMISSEGKWNEPVVRQLVTLEDAEIILRMPLPYTNLEDRFLWPHSKTGEPHARSVYHRLREVTTPTPNRDQINNTTTGLWNKIWSANTIPRAKNFVWRLATNALAVKTNFIKRGMVIDPGCSMCGEIESTEHMAVGCKWIDPIWTTVLGRRIDEAAVHNITECLAGWGTIRERNKRTR